jgi:hypothetical protein
MLRSHPEKVKTERARNARETRKSVLDIVHSQAAQALEELPGLGPVEFGVAARDAQEEMVLRGALELRHVEEGVVVARQAVEEDHAQHRRERGEEDGQLERNRDALLNQSFLLKNYFGSEQIILYSHKVSNLLF